MLLPILSDIHFERPWFLLLALPVLWLYYLAWRKHKPATLRVNRIPVFTQAQRAKIYFRNIPLFFRLLAALLIIVCIATPVKYKTTEINSGEGIEIVLCLDVSGSMLAKDFSPNRLVASQQVASDFIKKRRGDKIGLVVFAGQSLTICPVTTDHNALLFQLNNIEYGMLLDGTSIGSGLASSVERLRLGKAKSKVVVLLTDGEDTGGKISPDVAKDLAKTFGIRVYTIGVGTEGFATIPYQTATGTTVMEKERVSVDEDLLKGIAAETGGKYYRATNTASLQQIYDDIESLEKTDIQTSQFNKKNYVFMPWLGMALMLLILGWILQHTWLRRFP
jgi:Ca-activated chloride channel family protein